MDIFHSSEIRWFSKSEEPLKTLYEKLPGDSTEKEARSDLYLKSYNSNTGVKIREGKHEIKVKNQSDEKLLIGSIEDWTKWSSSPKQNILNSVDQSIMNDWQKVNKTRIKKQYEIADGQIIHNNDKVQAGCGIEFTKIEIIKDDEIIQWYTYGLEAFGEKDKCRTYLKLILEELNPTDLRLAEMICMSYPAFLSKFYDKKY